MNKLSVIVHWAKWLKAELRWHLTHKAYRVEMSELAEKQLSELPEEDRKAILEAIAELGKNPYKGKPISPDEVKDE